MKRNILEILAYMFDVVASNQLRVDADRQTLTLKLEEAGFARGAVTQAINWLGYLVEQQSQIATNASKNKTLRIFSLDEQAKISLEVRNFILSLEQIGVFDTRLREVVINQLLQLNQRRIELVDVKWVALLVLMSKTGVNKQVMRKFLLSATAQEA